MITKTEQRKADLYTHSVGLSNGIIILFGNRNSFDIQTQHKVDNTDNGRMYCFYNMPRENLLSFLNRIENSLEDIEYEVRDSQSGEFIKIRKNRKVITEF
ncbi:MAG: hypothetical protein IIA87_05440 [Nanoarchaeota archaeon]|nr:hypothetical protein [Nanoarchaeota archaeon]